MRSALVIIVSDRAATGERPDTSGPPIAAMLASAGFQTSSHVIPDDIDAIVAALTDAVASGSALVVTTGGTGLGPRDVTPEATAQVIEREIPGLAEAMRTAGLASTPMAALSRSRAGTAGSTLIVNLPGSPSGALESLGAILDTLPHAVDVLRGSTAH